ncbi:MAG: Zn-dependent hydrolase [Desulfobacterales bacterium]|nr:Zn-dependent hydrolase [Desulfobacterales bacterium]
MDVANLRINGNRLQQSLEEMAKIGATSRGGVTRLALSDEDKQARDLFVKWLKEIDCEITIDDMGSIFGTLPGSENNLPSVMSGSHIDSQPRGGRFDGILGVMGALEILRTIRENNIQINRPVTAVAWTNEEGTRFSPAMIASGVWAGSLKKDYAYNRTDPDGKRFEGELIRIGYKGPSPAKRWPVHAYYEYHIEQGPVLESKNRIIGVPKGIVNLNWYDIYIEGESNQAGPTPMVNRHDSLVAASEMIIAANEIPNKFGGDLVTTVGRIDNEPNSVNIIPGQTHFTFDIRSWNDGLTQRALDNLLPLFKDIADKRGCIVRIEETWRVKHSPFDPKLVRIVNDSAIKLGFDPLEMTSGAGHDAAYINQVAPTAMIFVPSIGGRSHVEIENTTWEDCKAGADVLLQCMLQSANEA